jgi:eukaryotic-like serine/threonine-protein kinase
VSGDDTLAATSAGTTKPHRDRPTVVARGEVMGRYVILEEIGAGGMGSVYAAYDPELDRKVAIKLLHLHGRDPATAQTRLQREAQAMAKLSHPNVANVHDVGTMGDRVWIAMEFVGGQTLAKWLAAETRSWREILGVFAQIGRGIAAAHAEGILHRDVKPDNMMIDGRGRARVMDFGLARSEVERPAPAPLAPVQDSTETTLPRESERLVVTRAGAIVGTPRYMAPEQFERGAIDARADQFGFCVALWEGLYGERPFAGEDISQIVGAVTRGERRSPPKGRHVPAFVRRALERGLSTRPEDRWPTMDALLAELSRDPTRRWARWGGGTAVTLAVILVAAQFWRSRATQCTGAPQAIADAWDEARRVQVQEAVLGTGASFAPGVWQHVAPQLDQWVEDWIAMHTDACEATRRRGEQSEAVMDLRMACLHRAKLGFVAATNVLVEATPQVVENAHELAGGLPRVSVCADLEALQADVAPPDASEAQAVEEIRAEIADAKARREAGDYAAALSAAQRADAHADQLQYEPIRTDVWLELGVAYDAVGRYADAEAALWRAQQQGARWKQWDPVLRATATLIVVIGYHARRPVEALALRNLAIGLSAKTPEGEATVRANVGSALFAQGEYGKAEEEYEAALAILPQAIGADHPRVAALRNNLAEALFARGHYEEAATEHRAVLAIRERILGAEHPDVAQSRSNLANVLVRLGKFAEAETEQRAVLTLRQRALGSDHPDVGASHQHLANALRPQGKYVEAETENRAALAIRTRALGSEHPEVAASHNSLGVVLAAQGRYAEAEAEYRSAIAIREKLLGREHPDVLVSRSNLANVLAMTGHEAAAESEARAVLSAREQALGPDHAMVATSRSGLAVILGNRGKYEEAERELRAALAAREHALGSDHPDVASSRHDLAEVLRARGKHTEAEAEERAALELGERVLGPDHPEVAASRHGLGEILRGQGTYETAETEQRAALRIRETSLGADHPDVAESLAGLGQTLAAEGRLDEAVVVLDRAWTILQRSSARPRLKAETAFALARATWSAPASRERARTLAEEALALYRRAGEAVDEPAADAVATWLRRHRR